MRRDYPRLCIGEQSSQGAHRLFEVIVVERAQGCPRAAGTPQGKQHEQELRRVPRHCEPPRSVYERAAALFERTTAWYRARVARTGTVSTAPDRSVGFAIGEPPDPGGGGALGGAAGPGASTTALANY